MTLKRKKMKKAMEITDVMQAVRYPFFYKIFNDNPLYYEAYNKFLGPSRRYSVGTINSEITSKIKDKKW